MAVKPVHLLCFAPHPHDADGTIGGLAARMVKEGKDVVFVIVTNGDKGTSDPSVKPEDLAKIREEEQRNSAKILGVREVVFMNVPDLCTEDTPELRKDILRLILTYKPEIVGTRDPWNSPYVSNRDHRNVGRIVLDAVWPYALSPGWFPDLLKEGLAVHKTKEVLLWTPQDPNYRCDITNELDAKLKAVACHKTQIPVWEHEKEVITNKAIREAEGTEFEYAEAFVRVSIPQAL